MRKPNGYWDEQTCFDSAKKCKTIKEFSLKFPRAYVLSCEHGWRKNYTWLKRSVALDETSLSYLIYAYEDYQNKICYVGLTKDLIKRKSAHKKMEYYKDKQGNKHHYYDSVAKYFISINKPIPEPKILEENLNMSQSQTQEKYWVDYYLSKGWKLLNIAKTGKGISSVGGCQVKWTKDKIIEVAKTCKNAKEFNKKFDWAYKVAKEKNMLNELFNHPIENLDGEIWTDIPNINGYQISNYKRVKKLPSPSNISEKLMAIISTKNNYYVSLRIGNKNKQFRLERLYNMVTFP